MNSLTVVCSVLALASAEDVVHAGIDVEHDHRFQTTEKCFGTDFTQVLKEKISADWAKCSRMPPNEPQRFQSKTSMTPNADQDGNRCNLGDDMDDFLERLRKEEMVSRMEMSNFTCILQQRKIFDDSMNFDFTGFFRDVDATLPRSDQWMSKRRRAYAKMCVERVTLLPDEHFRGSLDENFAKGNMFFNCFMDFMAKLCEDSLTKIQLEGAYGPISTLVEITGLEEDALLRIAAKIL